MTERAPRTQTITFRASLETYCRLTALARLQGCTKTELLLAAVERLLRENEVPGGEDENV